MRVPAFVAAVQPVWLVWKTLDTDLLVQLLLGDDRHDL